MRVDAHHHLWDLRVRAQDWLAGDELAPINRSFLSEDYERVARAAGIDASVLVQTVPVPEETPEFLDLAAHSELIRAVTGWTDLTAPDVADAIARLLDHPHARYLRAVRAQVQSETDPRWLCRGDVRRGLQALGDADLLGELVVLPHQLPAVVETVSELAEVQFVLDHAGKPDLRGGDLSCWERDVRALGALPNVTCKLSGLVTEASWSSWTVADLRPVAEVVLEAFGPERVMLGSDWPVCELAGGYAAAIGAYRELLAELDDTDRARVEGDVAAQVYGLR